VVSIAVGIGLTFRDDNGITLLATLVNFGALTAFLLLHLAVLVHYLVRRRSRDYLRHLVVPLCGLVILTYVLIQAKVAAQVVGLTWLGIGIVVMVGLLLTGRTTVLAEPETERVR
jgi:amino acid transporter